MDKAKKALMEWAVNFIENKDVFTRNLNKIEKDKDDFEIIASYNNREEYIIVEPFVNNPDSILAKLVKEKNISIFLFNSYENFIFLVDNWKRLVEFDKLTFYFVNMFSNTDKKWAIKPKLHNLISDSSSLKGGLNSMFMTVEPITKEQIGKIYKQ